MEFRYRLTVPLAQKERALDLMGGLDGEMTPDALPDRDRCAFFDVYTRRLSWLNAWYVRRWSAPAFVDT